MLHQKNINGIVQAQRWRWAMQLFAETGAISFRPVFFVNHLGAWYLELAHA